MTKEEAIECLNFQNEKFFGGQSEALKMAVLALEKNESAKEWYKLLCEKWDSAENKGEWEDGNNICPKCGENKFKGLEADIYADWQPNFCPNCGADMRGGKAE